MPGFQTDVLEVVLIDPNQTGTKLTVNEAIDALAKCLAEELVTDLSLEVSPYTLPYDPTEGEDKTGLHIYLYTFTGATGAPFVVRHPAVRHFFVIENQTNDDVTIEVLGGAGVLVTAGTSKFCYCDTVDIVDRSPPSLIGDNTVTNAKLADIAQYILKGRTSSGSGDPEDLVIGEGFDFNGLTIHARSQGVFKTATYTPVLGDAGKTFFMNGGVGDNHFNIPPEGAVNYPLWTTLHIVQWSVNSTLLIEGSGVQLNMPEALQLAKQYAGVTIQKVASDVWWGQGYTDLFSS